jgi:glutamyl-tRNA(Gln) amidotransferase subunit E
VRVIACLSRLPNMAHSDVASESLYGRDWQRLRKKMSMGENDALILVWGSPGDTATACQEIIARAREATQGIPSDTRQALKDGTTGFERVLPGAERMYPDTDLPPMPIDNARLSAVEARLPAHVWGRELRFREMGVPEDAVQDLLLSPRTDLFFSLIDRLKIDPVFAAVVLCQRLKALRRSGLQPDRLSDQAIFEVFRAYSEDRLVRRGVIKLIRSMLQNDLIESNASHDVAAAIEALGLRPVPDDEARRRVADAVTDVEHASFRTSEQRSRHLMGVLMSEWNGRLEGSHVARLVAEEVTAAGIAANP